MISSILKVREGVRDREGPPWVGFDGFHSIRNAKIGFRFLNLQSCNLQIFQFQTGLIRVWISGKGFGAHHASRAGSSFIARRAYCVGTLKNPCVCVRSFVRSSVSSSVRSFFGPFLEHENGDTKAETLRKGSEKRSKRLKFEQDRDDKKLTRS